jgi:Reverse transcriptase (RNA-dependent DNA polymerase)
MEDVRPISVTIGIIKIISKLLANRLKTHLHKMINNHQSAFIMGRYLTETFVVAKEELIFRHNEKIPSILLKVDFKKVFNMISWNFILLLLLAKEFHKNEYYGLKIF